MNKFNQQTSMPVVPPPVANYAEKQFLHTFVVGVWLPLLQASITAVVAFIGTLIVLYLLDAIDILKPALMVAAITWVVMWLYLMRRWLNITAFERVTGIDINGDGVIGAARKKPNEPLVIRLDDVRNGNYRSRTMELEVTEEELVELARGLLNGRPFTEREWTGKGKPFSSGQEGSFRRLRSAWLKQGLLQVVSDKDHRQGFDFTDEGWATLEKLAGVVEEEVEEAEVEVVDMTDEQMEAIARENAAYAERLKVS